MRAHELQSKLPPAPVPRLDIRDNGTAPINLKALDSFGFSRCARRNTDDPRAPRAICAGAIQFNCNANKVGFRMDCGIRKETDVSPDVAKNCPYFKYPEPK